MADLLECWETVFKMCPPGGYISLCVEYHILHVFSDSAERALSNREYTLRPLGSCELMKYSAQKGYIGGG